MQNKGLELQKIILNSVKNINVLQEKNINIFTSIPNDIKTPYIKVYSLTLNTKDVMADMQHFTIDLFVMSSDKNNRQIIEIMEGLYQNISQQITEYTYQNNIDEYEIYNIYNENYSIYEDLQNANWYGHFIFEIDIK